MDFLVLVKDDVLGERCLADRVLPDRLRAVDAFDRFPKERRFRVGPLSDQEHGSVNQLLIGVVIGVGSILNSCREPSPYGQVQSWWAETF